MLVLALHFAVTPGLAFAPSQETWQGREPNRVYRYHEGYQTRLRHGDAWEAFTAGIGAGWYARFDERTGTPHRAWGPPIPLADTASPEGVERSVRAFLADAGIAGVDDAALKLRSANHAADTDTWYITFDRYVSGYPIWRGGIDVRVRFGSVFMVEVDTYPAWQDLGGPQIDSLTAVASAELYGPAPMGRHTDESARLVVLPWEGDGPLDLRLVYEVRTRTDSPLGVWVSFVDARTGDLLDVYNEIRFFSGTVYGTHDTRTVDGSFTTSALPLINFTGSDGGAATAGEDGTYSLSDDETWTMGPSGAYVNVRNRGSGGTGSMDASGTAPTWDTTEATQAEIDSYKFLHDVRLWGHAADAANPMSEDRLTSNVNLSSTCNAYYDGSVNFYSAGGSCNNTGQIADVNYHEWGHGFHYYALQSGTYDGALSEGTGDMISAIVTHDADIGPYFYTNGRPIRSIDDDRVYPDDISSDTHETGLIWAGAVWDTWEEIYGTYGEDRAASGVAFEIVSHDFAYALRAGPTIEESYDEFSAADDDDGDLSNGTPHACEIIDGFAPHGLGPTSTGSLVSIDHVPVENQPPDTTIPVAGAFLNLAPDCVSASLVEARVVYSTDVMVTWTEADLTIAGTALDGTIPGLPDGTVVWYYLRTLADDGTEIDLPPGGAIAPYSFYVGNLEEISCSTFETDDGGYTHELRDGDDREGADDWVWGQPDAYADDPARAYSGRKVWGNDLGGGNYNGEYQANITNRLTSAPIDLLGASTVIVQFRRWLNVEDGIHDQATVYANDVAVWENHSSNRNIGDEHTQDGDWKLHTVRLDGVSSPLSLAWEISSDDGSEYGGWNIDDVCVYAQSDIQSAFTIDDFVASDDETGKVTMSWTQPLDTRATDVVVMRGADGYPQTRDEGEIAWSGEAAPGTPMSVEDPVTGTWYYTAFAGGDDGWLSGATEGANADVGTGLADGDQTTDEPGVDPDEKITLPGGCGCASSPGSGAGLLGLLAATGLLVVRRRQ